MDAQLLLPLLIAFIAGFGIGWMSRVMFDTTTEKVENSERKTKNIKEAVQLLLVFIITIVWVVSIFTQVSNPQFEVRFEVHAIMGIVVGFFFKPGEIINLNSIFKNERKEDGPK